MTPARMIWVVELRYDCGGTLTKQQRDTKYVRAGSQKGAVATARLHSSLPRSAQANARHATPADLGCVPVRPMQEVA